MSSPFFETAYRRDPLARWLRGNLHAHSTRSDGRLDIQDVIRAYANLGHHFLMLSDHDVCADFSGLEPCGLILLRGNEVSARGPHILHVGAASKVEPLANRQAVIEAIRRDGGFAILNHPNWEDDFDHYPFELLCALKGFTGIELFNGTVIEHAGNHLAVDKWDRLLSSGARAWGFANDDSHQAHQVGLGWNVVRVRETTAAAILQALHTGNFYASSGVAIEEIYADGPVIHVRAPEADAIAVVGDHGWRWHWVEAGELSFDVSNVFSTYFRVECYGRAGRMAWSQPFFAKELRERMERLEKAERPALKALRVDHAPEHTGLLDDPLWSKAPAAEQFTLMSTGVEPPVRTTVHMLLAPSELCLGARCEEPHLDKLRVAAKHDHHPGMYTDDSVEFFLGIDGDTRDYLQVLANAAGFVNASPMGIDASRVPAVRCKAGRSPNGWCVDVRVPLAALQANSAPGARWRFHICRNRPHASANSVWAWVGKSNHNPHKFGWLEF